MTTVFRSLNEVIDNSALPIIFGPFQTVSGLIGGWRFSGSSPTVDLSGNGHVLTAEGAPAQGSVAVNCSKSVGYLTDIPDRLSLSLLAVHALYSNVDDYASPVNSLRQANSGQGIGTGIVLSSNATSNISRDAGPVGNTAYNAALGTTVSGTAETYAKRLDFRFVGLTLDAASSTGKLYQPRLTTTPITVSDPDIATRTVSGRVFRIGSWSNPDLPQVGQVSIAEVLIYDHALTDADMMLQYQRSQTYMAGLGYVI